MQPPQIVTSVRELQRRSDAWRGRSERIALVPTMGALHCGHLALVTEAGNLADRVVVSIFVNPAQFAPHEDFERYPRTIDDDCSRLAANGASDLVFAPPVEEFYPEGFATRIEMSGPADGLEAEFRPHFFSGVATVVAKLFIAARPDFAVFGEKDYQQLLVVRRLARDLGLAVEIVGVPIVREPDGLAMSSRNAFLATRERRVAAGLNQVLADAAARVRAGMLLDDVESAARQALLTAGFDTVDYVAVRDAATLARPKHRTPDLRVLAAATIGAIRLIDNMKV